MKMKKWIIILILVIMLAQTNLKKEGNFGIRCSTDKHSIEVYNKDTNKYTDITVCNNNELCKEEQESVKCVPQDQVKKSNFSPLLLIAGILFVILGGKKWIQKR